MERFSFTQCTAVLFTKAPLLEDVERALGDWYVIGKPNEGKGEHGWALSGPGFILILANGTFLSVDVVDSPWPDDPVAAETIPGIGGAWRAGAFGPYSTPGALARAADQAWTWRHGAKAASEHGGFVRLRTGRNFPEGADQDLPADYDPVYELANLTEVAQVMLRLPGALGFFVPGGEALRSGEQVDAALARKTGSGGPSFELWTNVRAVALLRDADAHWLSLDTVGMSQLRVPDQEAIFAEGQEAPDAAEAMMRNVALHLLAGKRIAPGSTADDARGRQWRASHAIAIVAPQRPVIRWLPEASARPSEATLAKLYPPAAEKPSP